MSSSPDPESELRRLDGAVAALRLRMENGPDADEACLSLSSVLGDLSIRLGGTARQAEARDLAEESVACGRRAMERIPDRGRFLLVSALVNRSAGLLRDGEGEGAVAGLTEAVGLVRDAGADGLAFLGAMVEALHRTALAFSEIGSWTQAVAMRRLILDLFGSPVPPAAIQMLALTLIQGARVAEGEPALFPGLAWAEESVGLARTLVGDDPEGASLLLAQALGGLSAWRLRAGDTVTALNAALESVDLLQKVVVREPIATVPTLVLVLDSLSQILTELGLDDQAETVRQQRAVLRTSLDRVHDAAAAAEA